MNFSSSFMSFPCFLSRSLFLFIKFVIKWLFLLQTFQVMYINILFFDLFSNCHKVSNSIYKNEAFMSNINSRIGRPVEVTHFCVKLSFSIFQHCSCFKFLPHKDSPFSFPLSLPWHNLFCLFLLFTIFHSCYSLFLVVFPLFLSFILSLIQFFPLFFLLFPFKSSFQGQYTTGTTSIYATHIHIENLSVHLIRVRWVVYDY